MRAMIRSAVLLLAVAIAVAACDSPTAPDPLRFHGCDVQGRYRIGWEVNGELDEASCQVVLQGRQAPFWVDYYDVRIGETREVQFDVTATDNDFDAILILWELDTTIQVAVDDDGGIGLNPSLEVNLDSGHYVLGVISYWEDSGGPYRLTSQ